MKRFATLTTKTALLGALLTLTSGAFAADAYRMYLVPISPTNVSYSDGQVIQFSLRIDVPANPTPYQLTVGASVGYDSHVFDDNGVSYSVYNPGYNPHTGRGGFWDIVYQPTYHLFPSGFETLQQVLTHSKVVSQGVTQTVAPGTYTIATYAFPVIGAPGPTDITLPSAYSSTLPVSSTDYITVSDSTGTYNAVLDYPNTVGKHSKLTYYIGISPTATVSGTLHLEGIASTAPDQPTTFVFRPLDNSGDIKQTILVPASGNFSLTVPRNNYILHVKSDKYLASNVPVDATGTTAGPLQATLPAGDANNDNSVNIADFGRLINAYGSQQSDPTSGYDANADFNGDGTVDIADFSLLTANFGAEGDN